MSYKIAVATSDSQNVDLHFGAAESLKIYAVEGLDFQFLEERKAVGNGQAVSNDCSSGCGNGGGSGCGNGCSGGGGADSVELVADCRAVVAAKIGKNVLRQLELRAISAFDVTMPISDALTKIVAYYYKMDNRKLR